MIKNTHQEESLQAPTSHAASPVTTATSFRVVKKDIAEGGEATIHIVEINGERQIFKQFRTPKDPLFNKEDAALAKAKIAEYKEKLYEFPKLSPRIVTPKSVVVDNKGNVTGYTMEFISHATSLATFMHKDDRVTTGYSLNNVVELFLDLHDTLKNLHERDAVIGDFRPENVLCRSGATYIIDAESMQFGRWKNHTFSEQWADPRS